ncbi:hypothetical protein M9H77_03778 [Catharanthus roseus]|uniref:Uncharacterized protein n=1 Tax=Catharanthus roseus TaxID=4058 RepID=A0ACC0CCA0_CATRO|nr:hypothetical protein M9H77_03778 [Catharanthus roseus]
MVLDWVKELQLLDRYVFNLARCVNYKELKMADMKSHDCHKYELELRNINSNVTEKEIQEKISKGFAKWFRNEEKFHEFRRKAEEDVEASGTAIRSCISAMLLDHEQRLMQRVNDVISRVFVALDKHMRWLFEHNHLAYITFPLMMPLVRVAMSVDPSTSSLTATAARTSDVLTRDYSTPSSIHAPGPTAPLLDPTDGTSSSSKHVIYT